MAGPGSPRSTIHAFCVRLALAALLALFALAPAARADAPPAANQRCMGCHAHRGLTKQMEDANRLALTVSPDLYAHSAHATNACTDCHADIDRRTHPKKRQSLASARQSCKRHRGLLPEMPRQGSRRVGQQHPRRVGQGRQPRRADMTRAPPAACRNQGCRRKPLKPPTASPATRPSTPPMPPACTRWRCSRASRDSPACAGCHGAHNVSVASTSAGPVDACVTCHDDALPKHQAWLPKTRRCTSGRSPARCATRPTPVAAWICNWWPRAAASALPGSPASRPSRPRQGRGCRRARQPAQVRRPGRRPAGTARPA